MSLIIKGRVWVFGNNISTDLISPGTYQWETWEDMKSHVLEAANSHFPKEVKEGDILIAGLNFGCGSSRESAPINLIKSGIKCIVGESFGRIFFRNCIALGLPILKCLGVSSIFEQGDIAVVDIERAIVKNNSKNLILNAEPLSAQIVNIIKEGGLFPMLKKY